MLDNINCSTSISVSRLMCNKQSMTLQAIRYQNGTLSILDQLELPSKTQYVEVTSVKEGWDVIKTMKVRGAPAIALVGTLSIVVEVYNQEFESTKVFVDQVRKHLAYLITARPTAVNMRKTSDYLLEFLSKSTEKEPVELKASFISKVEKMLKKDLQDNTSIGDLGAEHIIANALCQKNDGNINILTHCNTGSLATSGYGTALGVIRSLHAKEVLNHAYCTETRPYNQGARLTAYELVHDRIPATLIADSMVSLLMKSKMISAVVVGADRVAKNGDTANKIGTYQIAIAAKYHGVPFYVAAPVSSIDFNTKTGEEIVIEMRSGEELAKVNGVRIAAEGIACWNPAFDVTPHELITGGIITEHGVFSATDLDKLLFIN